MNHKRRALELAMLCLSIGVPVATIGTQPPKLPEKPYPRIAAPDLNQPLPLPILGTPVRDREPLTDVTVESSRVAALSGPLPIRTSPAPFVKHQIPDPFEHQRTMHLRTPLP